MKKEYFHNVEIIPTLKAILDSHTKYCKETFEIDKAIIRATPEGHDNNLIWVSYPVGTLCVPAKDFVDAIYSDLIYPQAEAYLIYIITNQAQIIRGDIHKLDFQRNRSGENIWNWSK